MLTLDRNQQKTQKIEKLLKDLPFITRTDVCPSSTKIVGQASQYCHLREEKTYTLLSSRLFQFQEIGTQYLGDCRKDYFWVTGDLQASSVLLIKYQFCQDRPTTASTCSLREVPKEVWDDLEHRQRLHIKILDFLQNTDLVYQDFSISLLTCILGSILVLSILFYVALIVFPINQLAHFLRIIPLVVFTVFGLRSLRRFLHD
jgi:hypothetical protein